MKNTMPSSVEVEVVSLFHNVKAGEPTRVALEEISHPQQAMPMQTDNSATEGISI